MIVVVFHGIKKNITPINKIGFFKLREKKILTRKLNMLM